MEVLTDVMVGSLGSHVSWYWRASHKRVPHGRTSHRRTPWARSSWACTSFTSLPCASDTGGENPYIDTQDGLKASDCGRLGRQAAGHPWSALRVVKSCRKTAQRPRYCQSQSSSSASKAVPELTI